MYEETINPWELHSLAITVLKEMMQELGEELKKENFNDLALLGCLFHNVSVQAKYVEGIEGDIKVFEDKKLNEMLKNSQPSIPDMPSYC